MMSNNTSVSLGDYFEEFVDNQIAEGRFKNASEVIRAGLRHLEEEENKLSALRKAVHDGIGSGLAAEFKPANHLANLKATRKKRV